MHVHSNILKVQTFCDGDKIWKKSPFLFENTFKKRWEYMYKLNIFFRFIKSNFKK